MTTRRIQIGRVVLMGLMIASLAGSAVLPGGQVVSVVEMDVAFDDDHGPMDVVPQVVPPNDEQVGLMGRVVELQMQHVIAPDGNAYLVLGAVLRSTDETDGFACVAILHRYGSSPPCTQVLAWQRQ